MPFRLNPKNLRDLNFLLNKNTFFAGRSNVPIPWDTLILSVVLFVVIPLAGGMLTRSAVIKRKGQCTLRRLSSVCLTVQLPLAYC